LRFLLTTTLLFILSFVQGQTSFDPGTSGSFYIPVERTIYYKLGDKTIPILIQQFGEATDLVFINLHSNETTSVQAARSVLETRGGTLIKIEHGVQRTIRFKFGYMNFNIDPNRIFSRNGIWTNMKEVGRIDEGAIEEVEKFGQRIITLIENASCIIALHNNTNESFSIKSYLPRGDRQKDAKAVYANPEQDVDDIALTTDSLLYQKMADLGYNSILQDNINVKKDGSLSVWSGENGKRYINIETEHGKVKQYVEMLEKFLDVLAVKEESLIDTSEK
jgi:hypothetical protein